MSQLVNFVRKVRKNPVQRMRLHGRMRYRVSDDLYFGYAWKQGRYGYILEEHVWPHRGWRFLRKVLDSLAPLGQEWAGRTSQGRPVSLYRSSYGLDYNVAYTAPCDNGTSIEGRSEALIPVRRDGFSDHRSYSYKGPQGNDHNVTAGFEGSFGPGGAAGTFGINDQDVDSGTACSATGMWSASPVK